MKGTNDPTELELTLIMLADDAAQEEADKWIQENQDFQKRGAGVPTSELADKIRNRFEPVRRSYETFIEKHPRHVRGRLAYGSFLTDINEDYEGMLQWEKARDIDPSNPASWNNLANYYGHRGPVKKAFEYYAKAVELNPAESVYYHNFATTVFLFRKDAQEFYEINEQKVFDKAMELYRKALELDPRNFPLATDIAQTYYGIKPPRVADALKAWDYALNLASDSLERDGTRIHIARVKISAGDFNGAREQLTLVTNTQLGVLKGRLEKNLVEREARAKAPDPAPAASSSVRHPAAP